jgi:hypothetical protein
MFVHVVAFDWLSGVDSLVSAKPAVKKKIVSELARNDAPIGGGRYWTSAEITAIENPASGVDIDSTTSRVK